MRGKVVFITGATSGIGLEVSKALIKAGVTVILGSKSEKIDRNITNLVRKSSAQIQHCNLSDINQIHRSVEDLSRQYDKIDVLVNNAGIMEPPYALTKQGYESQFGINYIGHYALTLLLLQRFKELRRIVTVGSLSANSGSLDFSTFQSHENYDKSHCYRQSKLANNVFSYDLNARLKNSGYHNTLSLGAHPGYARTKLQRHVSHPLKKLHSFYTKWTKAQSAKDAALSILFAITDNEASSLDYYVPGGIEQLRGKPIKVVHPASNFPSNIADDLWNFSQTKTGITL